MKIQDNVGSINLVIGDPSAKDLKIITEKGEITICLDAWIFLKNKIDAMITAKSYLIPSPSSPSSTIRSS